MSEHSKLYLPLKLVKKNKHCGAYIIDDLGTTVCDLYFMKESKVIEFDNADEYMKLIVYSVNNFKRYEEALEEISECPDRWGIIAINALQEADNVKHN